MQLRFIEQYKKIFFLIATYDMIVTVGQEIKVQIIEIHAITLKIN